MRRAGIAARQPARSWGHWGREPRRGSSRRVHPCGPLERGRVEQGWLPRPRGRRCGGRGSGALACLSRGRWRRNDRDAEAEPADPPDVAMMPADPSQAAAPRHPRPRIRRPPRPRVPELTAHQLLRNQVAPDQLPVARPRLGDVVREPAARRMVVRTPVHPTSSSSRVCCSTAHKPSPQSSHRSFHFAHDWPSTLSHPIDFAYAIR